MKDLREDVVSHENAISIYHVVDDPRTLIVDVEAIANARAAERHACISRGRPVDAFCREWVTAEPPTDVPCLGSRDRNDEVWATLPGMVRTKMPVDSMQGIAMPNPKDR